MELLIEYYCNIKLVGSEPCQMSLDDADKHAQLGIVRHQADFAVILDMDNQGKRIRLVKRS